MSFWVVWVGSESSCTAYLTINNLLWYFSSIICIIPFLPPNRPAYLVRATLWQNTSPPISRVGNHAPGLAFRDCCSSKLPLPTLLSRNCFPAMCKRILWQRSWLSVFDVGLGTYSTNTTRAPRCPCCVCRRVGFNFHCWVSKSKSKSKNL